MAEYSYEARPIQPREGTDMHSFVIATKVRRRFLHTRAIARHVRACIYHLHSHTRQLASIQNNRSGVSLIVPSCKRTVERLAHLHGLADLSRCRQADHYDGCGTLATRGFGMLCRPAEVTKGSRNGISYGYHLSERRVCTI